MFEGSIVAIVTPFKKNKVDESALKKLIEWHIKEGTNAIVPCGTTGESATLDYEEHHRVIELTVQTVKGRVPVIAGTGANSTDEAIMITKRAMDVGADGALLVSPYYNKPSQEGIYQHYKAIAESVKGFPLVLYNVPGRTASNMLPSTVAKLARIKNVVAIKEATGDMRQTSDLVRLCSKSKNFNIISGDDFTTFSMCMLGGKGVISVVANVMPGAVSKMMAAIKAGDIAEARKIHFMLEELSGAMFIDSNPVPVKTALAMMGKITEEFRLPLCRMSKENKTKLKNVLKKYKLVR